MKDYLSPDKNNAPEHAQAVLALHLVAGAPAEGESPSSEELALLAEGRLKQALGRQRYLQVLGHINSNPALLSQWLNTASLLGAESEQQAHGQLSASGTLAKLQAHFRQLVLSFKARHWLPALALAGVLAISFVLIPQSPITTGTHPQPEYANTGTTPEWVALLGMAQGLSNLQEAEAKRLLGATPRPALPSSVQVTHNPMAYQLGLTLVKAKLECTTGELSTQTQQTLAALHASLNLSNSALTPSALNSCHGVNQLWQQLLQLTKAAP